MKLSNMYMRTKRNVPFTVTTAPEPWDLASIGWLVAALINSAVLVRLAVMVLGG